MSRILLVDDNEDLREVVAWGLRDDGHDVVEASTAIEALALVRAAPPAPPFDLVVTDVVMPEMSGLDLVRALRECERPPPVLVVSDESYAEEAKALDVAGFVAKPCDFNELLARIESLGAAPN